MLPPARPLISPASGGLLGLGCEGDLRFSARWCRLGTSLSRFVFPVVDGEAAAAATAWNKSLQFCPCLVGACSGAGERFVRVESTGPVRVVLSRFALVLAGSGIGCASNRHPGMDWGFEERCRELAVGLVVARWKGRCSVLAARRHGLRFLDQRSSGCVPVRCSTLVFLFCRSCQSFQAMGLLLVLVVVNSSFSSCSHSGFGDGGGGRQWRLMFFLAVASGRRRRHSAMVDHTKDLQDLFVFSIFSRVFCVNCHGQLVSLCPSRRCLYSGCTPYVFLTA